MAEVQGALHHSKEFASRSIGLKAYCCLEVTYAEHLSSEVTLCGFGYQPCQ